MVLGGSGYPQPPARGRARSEDSNILLAVPKKGRLHEEIMKLLQGAGLDAKRPERLDVFQCKELPVKLVFLPASDIPMYVMDGNVDVGISGSDMLEETMVEMGVGLGEGDKKPPLSVLMELGFGKCRLCLQAPADKCGLGVKAFAGKRIVTSFPALAKKFFDSVMPEGHNTQIKVVSGSVEAAVGLGLAEAIVDLVETGTTMKAAGLDIVDEVFSTQAIIMQQAPTEENGLAGEKGELVTLIMKRIQGYITATRNTFLAFNCTDENLQACCSITPGKRSPTVTKLQESGWNSVSVVVEKKLLHPLMDKLTAAGAEDILCTALSNTRM